MRVRSINYPLKISIKFNTGPGEYCYNRKDLYNGLVAFVLSAHQGYRSSSSTTTFDEIAEGVPNVSVSNAKVVLTKLS